MAGERLVELMQQAAAGQQARSTPTDFVYGTVISAAPLRIQIDEKFPVDAGNLVLSALCKPFSTSIMQHKHKDSQDGDTDEQLLTVQLWRGLAAGDRVRMLQCNSGQKFYVLDREVFP